MCLNVFLPRSARSGTKKCEEYAFSFIMTENVMHRYFNGDKVSSMNQKTQPFSIASCPSRLKEYLNEF
jgi:hypothetical protein